MLHPLTGPMHTVDVQILICALAGPAAPSNTARKAATLVK
jgi:hypothetical protein